MKLNFIIITVLTCILFISLNSEATTYYISSNGGNDANSGISIDLPWKTINQVNSFAFVAGDSILFKKNEIWRGQLLPRSGNSSSDVYHGAYSSGKFPTILGSLCFNNPSDWISIGGNIWKCNKSFLTDIGNIIFNNSTAVGFKKWNLKELQNQNEFWYNLSSRELLIYSTSNPASLYSKIELALRKHIINQQNTSFVTYENISIKYGGAHGFGGGNTTNITVKSCEISYIGGGDLNMDGKIRFGNGIEFWGNASNNIVEKCKIWEIYDTGLSNQNHTTTALQQNIKYQNNIIWNCGLSSFEYWNRPSTSITSNIYFENNTCLNAGYGWGTQRPDYHGIHILFDSNSAQTDTIYVRNNILYNAKRSILAIEDNVNGKLKLDYNLFYQTSSTDTLFVSFPSFTSYLYSNFSSYSITSRNDFNSLTGNPNFVDLLGLDFSLQSNSKAIDSGANINIADDFNGNLRPMHKGYDIGAFEFSESLSINRNEYIKSIRVYPNPSSDSFRFSFNEKKQNLNIILYNEIGQKIFSIENYSTEKAITTKHIINGIYWIILKENSKIIARSKLLIQK